MSRAMERALRRFAAGAVPAHCLHPQTRDALLRRGSIRPVAGVTRILCYAGVFFEVPGAYERVPGEAAAALPGIDGGCP